MPRLNLSLETLGTLDHGMANRIVNAEIRSAIADLHNRGADGKERKVTIELSMVRMPGALERFQASLKAIAKVPPREVASTEASLQSVIEKPEQLGLYFQADSPERVDQNTFDFDETPPQEEPQLPPPG